MKDEIKSCPYYHSNALIPTPNNKMDLCGICLKETENTCADERNSGEGVAEDLHQLIRVALTNPSDMRGFIQANYPSEYAQYGGRNSGVGDGGIVGLMYNEITRVCGDAKKGTALASLRQSDKADIALALIPYLTTQPQANREVVVE